MVEVQEGGLGALQEYPSTGFQFVVDQADGVGDVRGEPGSTDAQVLLGHLVGIDGEAIEHPGENLVGVLQSGA